MKLKKKLPKEVYVFQFGGRVGGGSVSVPVPVEVQPTTSYAKGFSLTEPFVPTQPKVDKSKFKADAESLKKLEGHRNAVHSVYKNIQDAENVIANLSDLDILSNTAAFRTAMQQLNTAVNPDIVNQLKVDRENTLDAFKINTANKGEAAFMTLNGHFLVTDKKDGKIKTIDPSDYAANRDQYEALTSGMGFTLKDTDKNQVFNDIIPTSARQTYGIEHINKRLNDQFVSLGYSQQEQVTKALSEISAFGNDYKGFIEQGRSSGSNAAQIQSIKNYMWDYLNPDEKSQLRMVAINNGAKTPQEIETGAIMAMVKVYDKALKTEYSTKDAVDVPAGQFDDGGAGALLKGRIGQVEGTVFGGYSAPSTVQVMDGVKLDIHGNKLAGSSVFKPNYKAQVGDREINNLGTFSNSRMANYTRSQQLQTMDGKKLSADRTIVDKDNVYAAYALVGKNGNFITDANNPALKAYSQKVKSEQENAEKALGRELNSEEMNKIEDKIRIENPDLGRVQRVLIGNAYVNKDDIAVGDRKYYKPVKSSFFGDDPNAELGNLYETQTGHEAKAWYGNDQFYQTVFVVPAGSRFDARSEDGNEAFVPDTNVTANKIQEDPNLPWQMGAQPVQTNKGFSAKTLPQ